MHGSCTDYARIMCGGMVPDVKGVNARGLFVSFYGSCILRGKSSFYTETTQEYARLADGDPILGDLRAHGISAGVSICVDFTAETRAHAAARYSRYQYLFHCWSRRSLI